MSLNSTSIRSIVVLLTGVFAISPGTSILGQEDSDSGRQIEELIVTAQRIDEDIQDVPIAVTALTGDMLVEQQVITPSDLQMSSPGVTFTSTNFGGSSFSIRGIGSLAIGSSSIAGVSSHTNEVAIPTNLNTIEFFDLQRVEILRGPQGTLFGRNATGGAINFVTAKPIPEEWRSSLDYEAGSYNHQRLKGMLNVPISDNAAFRLAGFKLKRDGYTENLAYGQTDNSGNALPNIEERLDGRNMLALRGTFSLDLSESTDLWVMLTHFEERDDRSRITNQVCKRNTLPTIGCKPNDFGFDSPHLGSTTGGIFGGATGALPLGISGAGNSLFDYPRARIDSLRQVHTDFQPVYKEDEQVAYFGVNHELETMSMSVIGGLSKSDYLSQQDYVMDVGPTLSATPLNPTAFWPVSAPAGGIGEDWNLEGCSLNRGTAGAFGSCMLQGYDTSRVFTYDTSSSRNDYAVIEGKIHSTLPGSFNYLIGASAYDFTRSTAYYVFANTLDMVTNFGAPVFGLPPLYPGFFLNATAPDGLQRDGAAVFGEGYFDLSEDMKFTLGLRINNDNVERSDSSVLFNSINHAGVIFGLQQTILQIARAQAAAVGIPPEAVTLEAAIGGAIQGGLLDADFVSNTNIASGAFWSRTLNLLLGPFAQGPVESALLNLYGVSDADVAAVAGTPAYSAARVALSKRVPLVPQYNESRALTGSPGDASFSEMSGRVGIDYQVDNDTMWYGFVSKGYKPGGLNPAIPRQFQDSSSFSFEPESVIAFEVGRKSRDFDSRLTLNAAAFLYDYTGLQITVIKNNSAITENIDSTIFGFEFEGNYQFASAPQLGMDFSYGFLQTNIDGSTSIDTTNRTAGSEEWVLLNNIDPGALTAVNYIARENQLSEALVNQALAAGGALDIRNGATPVSVSYPTNSNGVAIPAYFSRAFLTAAGVETSDGIPTDLDGNTLPYSPDHTLRVGFSYTKQDMWAGNVTFRWDYYWQSEAYSRVYNTGGDEMDAWSQQNVSAVYESLDDKYSVSLWVRNVTDNENVTGHYLTSDTSGFFRNYFITEPRIIGLSASVNLF